MASTAKTWCVCAACPVCGEALSAGPPVLSDEENGTTDPMVLFTTLATVDLDAAESLIAFADEHEKSCGPYVQMGSVKLGSKATLN